MVDVDSPRTWLAGALTLITGMFAWSAGRNLATMDKANEARDKRADDISARVRILETNMATRTDIEGVYERINDLSETVIEHNGRVLEAISKRR